MWSIQLKLTLINWSLHCLIVNFAQHWCPSARSRWSGFWRVVGSVRPRREEWRQQQGVGLFWILHWRLCGLEAGPNTLKYPLEKNAVQRMWNSWELHKWGQSGFRTGRKSAFLKCYHIWSSSYSNFHRCGVTMTHLIGQVAWRRAARPRWEAGYRRQDRCEMQEMPAWTCLLDIPLPLHSQIPMVAMKNSKVRGYSCNE